MTEKSQDKNKLDQTKAAEKPKRRNREASEERLLSAGREVFSKVGFSSATTKMIAKKADVNESLITRYFDGKEGLLIAIIQSFIEDMEGTELPYEPQESLSEELRKYIESRLDQGCQHRDFANIIMSQSLVDRKFKKKVRDTVPLQMDQKLLGRVQRLADMGRLIPEASVNEICLHLDIYLDGIFFFGYLLREESMETLKERTRRFVAIYSTFYEKK